jgi:hypothetical protein
MQSERQTLATVTPGTCHGAENITAVRTPYKVARIHNLAMEWRRNMRREIVDGRVEEG